ncbi:MAG: hypothetical protein EXQ52_10285, partial [Bryobacterales bacterium]|nr:hypothetical protein [Bryobacterales bacterium]
MAFFGGSFFEAGVLAQKQEIVHGALEIPLEPGFVAVDQVEPGRKGEVGEGFGGAGNDVRVALTEELGLNEFSLDRPGTAH